MADITTLTRRLNYSKKQTAYAWARYYAECRNRLRIDTIMYERLTHSQTRDDSIPEHIKTELKDMAKELRKTWECPICMEMIHPTPETVTPETDVPDTKYLAITNCGHFYCASCLSALKRQAEPKCAICRKKLKPEEG